MLQPSILDNMFHELLNRIDYRYHLDIDCCISQSSLAFSPSFLYLIAEEFDYEAH